MKTRVIKSKEKDLADAAQAQVITMTERKTAPKGATLFERLAEDFFFHRNQFFHCLSQAFPDHRPMWYVDRFYPQAKGGPLAIDEVTGPYTASDIEILSLKRRHLKEVGVRYVLIVPQMTELEAMEQLA